ncbi:MAG: hypothetical protein HF981_00015 [Desulfobacteraceae bacterium]|nr:hypothetical protein [Desulfobacteraceae bacterium]MBC2748754.1 hypothetical protein [Desulfobacteraceae bacterium]
MKIIYLFVVGFLVTPFSCASITEVVPAGKDTYIIAGDDSSKSVSGASIKTDLYKKANTYCEAMGMKLMPLDESVFTYSAELRFRCLKEDDPEYARPNMKSVPDVRIETK